MNYKLTLRVLLGLLMLVSGLTKIFVAGPAGITQMLSNNFLLSWAPSFWAWILMIGETVFGLAILANFKRDYTRYSSWGASIILFIALITLVIKWSDIMTTSWSGFFFHLIAITSFMMLAEENKHHKQ